MSNASKALSNKLRRIYAPIPGIYQITNEINGKRYIGMSKNIYKRWVSHFANLRCNIHSNKRLQDDFNLYGITGFAFKILKEVKNVDYLIFFEKVYIRKLNKDFDYNLKDFTFNEEQKKTNLEYFHEYIYNKWLLPEEPNYDFKKYLIYKKEDKEEILKNAIDNGVMNVCKSKMSFQKIIKYMQSNMGYTIDEHRHEYKRCKVIRKFDP